MRDQEVDDAGAEIEAVEHHVGGEHDGDEAEPDGFHRSACRPSVFGPFLDLAANQEQEQDAEHGVHSHEADQGEQPVAGGDVR